MGGATNTPQRKNTRTLREEGPWRLLSQQFSNAVERSRTSTGVTPPEPESGASANSATTAFHKHLNNSRGHPDRQYAVEMTLMARGTGDRSEDDRAPSKVGPGVHRP